MTNIELLYNDWDLGSYTGVWVTWLMNRYMLMPCVTWGITENNQLQYEKEFDVMTMWAWYKCLWAGSDTLKAVSMQ